MIVSLIIAAGLAAIRYAELASAVPIPGRRTPTRTDAGRGGRDCLPLDWVATAAVAVGWRAT